MSWSKRVIQNGGDLPKLTDRLPTVQESLLQIGAESQSDRIYRELEKVRKEASDQGHAEGYARGFEEGVRAGRNEGIERGLQEALAKQQIVIDQQKAEVDRFAAAMADFVHRAEGAIEDWQRAAEQKLSTIAIEIARRALRKEMETSRDAVVEIAKQAIGETTNSDNFRIRVNPFDVSILESHKAELTASLSNIRHLEVVADEKIEGGCIIEADEGIIDGRIEGYIDRLEEATREAS